MPVPAASCHCPQPTCRSAAGELNVQAVAAEDCCQPGVQAAMQESCMLQDGCRRTSLQLCDSLLSLTALLLCILLCVGSFLPAHKQVGRGMRLPVYFVCNVFLSGLSAFALLLAVLLLGPVGSLGLGRGMPAACARQRR